jgi:type II secretory pathway pseudopilin PulG
MIELLVVIAIISMLIALLLPAVQQAREAARATQCRSKLRQLGLAAHNFHDVNCHFPPGVGFTPFVTGGVWAQHFFHLLPYLDQDNLYESALGPVEFPTGPITMYFPGNNGVYRQSVPVFLCPSDPGVGPGGVVTVKGSSEAWGASCYASNSQVFSPIPGDPQGRTRIAYVRDGLSNTIFYAEKQALCSSTVMRLDGGNLWAYCVIKNIVLPPPMDRPLGPVTAGFAIAGYFGNPNAIGPGSKFQVQPAPGNCDPTRTSTAHAGGMLVCLGDGSVRRLGPTMDNRIWWAAVTSKGGEVLGDW